MRLVERQRALVVTFALGMGAGCFTISPEQKQRDACTAICACFVGPTRVDACVEQCIPDLPPVSDPCLDCIYAHSQTCSLLVDECTELCVNPGTPLLGGM